MDVKGKVFGKVVGKGTWATRMPEIEQHASAGADSFGRHFRSGARVHSRVHSRGHSRAHSRDSETVHVAVCAARRLNSKVRKQRSGAALLVSLCDVQHAVITSV